MLFESAQRVVYKRATLMEAICTLEFQQELSIASDAQLLAEFHKLIKDKFPVYESGAAADSGGNDEDQSANWLHVFKADDGNSCVRLRDNAILLNTLDYNGWDEFKNTIDTALSALSHSWNVNAFTECTLRYINIIAPSMIGIEQSDLPKCLNSYINGVLSDREFASVTGLGVLSAFRVPLGDGTSASVENGLVSNSDTKEDGIILKITMWNSTHTGGQDAAAGQLETLHTIAGNCFRWCITDFLHQKMEPEPVQPYSSPK